MQHGYFQNYHHMHDIKPSKIINIECINPLGKHNMVVHEWGDSSNPLVIICLHGLTRSAQDFFYLANQLKKKFRILAPDFVGRGESDWLENENLYQVSQYINDLNSMFIQLKLKKINLIGTSLGGLIGLLISSSVFNKEFKNFPFSLVFGSNVKRNNEIIYNSLVINDFGAQVSIQSLFGLADQIDFDQNIEFKDFKEAVVLVKRLCKEFGPHSNSQWEVLTKSFLRPGEKNGTYKVHYDPKIVVQFRRAFSVFGGKNSANFFKLPDLSLWEFYDNLRCRTLLLRGKNSSILNREVALEMTTRGPSPKLAEFVDIGHAPSLMHDDQISIIKSFLCSQ